MSLESLVLLLATGVTKGAVYGLLALGFHILYAATRMLHFGYGAVAVLAGLVALTLTNSLHLPFWLVLIIIVLIGWAVGQAHNKWLLAPVRNRDQWIQMIALMAVGIVVENAYALVWGKMPKPAPAFTPGAVSVLGAPVSYQSLWIIGITVASVLAIKWLLDYTLMGKSLRGASNNPLAARLMGISVMSVGGYAYGMSMALAALGGMVISPITFAGGQFAFPLTMKGFASLVMGGMFSPIGAVIGGLLLGLIESVSVGTIGSRYMDVVSMSVLLLFLLVRPHGLFGGE